MVEVTVLGISLQGEGGAPVLLLHPQGTEQILSLSIGPMEAFAISSVLNAPEHGHAAASRAAQPVLVRDSAVSLSPDGRGGSVSAVMRAVFADQGQQGSGRPVFPRPQAHDLALNLLHMLGGRLLAVEIVRVADGIFLAEAVVSTGSGIMRADCRPSDGVAMALRCGARVRATESVLAYAEDIVDVLNALPEHVRLLARSRLLAPVHPVRKAAEAAYGAASSVANFGTSSDIPLAVEAALAVSDKFRGKETKSPWNAAEQNAVLENTVSGKGSQVKGRITAEPIFSSSSPGSNQSVNVSVGLSMDLGLEDMDAEAADIRSVARALRRRAEAAAAKVDAGQETKSAIMQGPSIRISLVQQKKDGSVELVDTAEITAKPRLLSSRLEELSEPSIVAVTSVLREMDGADEEERWAALLKVLTPETKALM